MSDTTEKWARIKGFEPYEVSSLGRVRSYLRKGPVPACGSRLLDVPRLIGATASPNGYYGVLLCDGPRRKRLSVHRLVLIAFVGDPPKGTECGHRNGDRSDNRLENLRWVTSKENQDDRRKHGTLPFGERHAGTKIDAAIVRDIRASHAGGAPMRSIASRIGIDPSTVRQVVTRKTWNHVT